jgi:hypothetical protein
MRSRTRLCARMRATRCVRAQQAMPPPKAAAALQRIVCDVRHYRRFYARCDAFAQYAFCWRTLRKRDRYGCNAAHVPFRLTVWR